MAKQHEKHHYERFRFFQEALIFFFWVKLIFSLFISIIALTFNSLTVDNIQFMSSQVFTFLIWFAIIIYVFVNFKNHENRSY